MIQRIQTLYLLGILGLMVALFFVPLGHFIANGNEYVITIWGIDALQEGADSVRLVPTTQMGILALLATLVPLVNIFLYRRRWIQIRLCMVEFVFLVGLQIFIGFYLFRCQSIVSEGEAFTMTYALVDFAPLLAILFQFLAFRGIAKDEALVRSLDRIR